MKKKAFFVAATGQHIGKTTTCLGLVSGLIKRFSKVGFIKPVGQEHVNTKAGLKVDKDALLFKEQFALLDDYTFISPVLFPKGFTRDFLDGNILEGDLEKKIIQSFNTISRDKECVIVEGTGHVGVGSIAKLSNAKVASLLGINMILIVSGGLGSAFDYLTLNKTLCDFYGVKIAGVILNRVFDDKREMVLKYMGKALSQWNIPILGCIPYDSFLSNPSMKDFEILFKTSLLSGKKHHMRHFLHTRLVAGSLEKFQELTVPNQLVITPANREDIILATLHKHLEIKERAGRSDGPKTGLILTGDSFPGKSIIKKLNDADIPMLYAPLSSYEAMQRITSYTVKIRKEDKEKVKEAINLVESHIDFDKLIKAAELSKNH